MVIDVPIMFFDGESSNNPGQGAAASILLMPNGKRFTVSQLLSSVTTQEAEYRGLIIGLDKAKKLGIRKLEIKGDSETVFNQINGLTKVSPENLKPLHFEARKLMRNFEKVSVEYISHEQNRSARAAVKRCIGEALGREKPKIVVSQPRMLPAVVEMIELGDNATEEDYRNLKLEQLDEYSIKSLAELRTFIPTEVQDTIALQWNGKEEELAEMYRWYLRGLKAEMAIKKVKTDYKDQIEPIPDKLPWEEALLVPTPNLFDEETEELPPIGEVMSLDQESPNSSEPESTQPSLEPVDAKIQETFLSLASLADSSTLEGENEVLLSEPHLEGSSKSEDPVASSTEKTKEEGKDTLPSNTRVSNILELIHQLSSSEKQELSQELVKSPEMVNLILKAIADNVTKGH